MFIIWLDFGRCVKLRIFTMFSMFENLAHYNKYCIFFFAILADISETGLESLVLKYIRTIKSTCGNFTLNQSKKNNIDGNDNNK